MNNGRVEVKILASKGISLSSRIIRWYQFGFPYTHVAYVLDTTVPNDPVVIEAWLPKVRYGKFSEAHTPGTEFTIFSVEVTKEQKITIEKFLMEQVGLDYDLLGLLTFAFRRKKFGRNNKWFCSELLFTAFKQADVELLKYTDPQEVTPALFLKSPYLKELYSTSLPK